MSSTRYLKFFAFRFDSSMIFTLRARFGDLRSLAGSNSYGLLGRAKGWVTCTLTKVVILSCSVE